MSVSELHRQLAYRYIKQPSYQLNDFLTPYSYVISRLQERLFQLCVVNAQHVCEVR